MKTITEENWDKVDPICEQMLSLSLKTGAAAPMFPGLWLKLILESQLDEHISDGLKSLFEMARGCMVYGYFYYPLFTIGVEQLYKCLEAAISEKYENCGGPEPADPKKFISFEKKINWLFGKGLISEDQQEHFHYARSLRNEAYHPMAQGLFLPYNASVSLANASSWVNELFSSKNNETV